MLDISSQAKIYLYAEPVDMRKSFDGLFGIIKSDPDVWKMHHPEAIRAYRTEERQEKASVALEQAAKRRVRSELRKSMKR